MEADRLVQDRLVRDRSFQGRLVQESLCLRTAGKQICTLHMGKLPKDRRMATIGTRAISKMSCSTVTANVNWQNTRRRSRRQSIDSCNMHRVQKRVVLAYGHYSSDRCMHDMK